MIFRPEPLNALHASTHLGTFFAILPALLDRTVDIDCFMSTEGTFIMSDYEDEMDVDASKDVQFSSDNASGKKRTVADLPVEAQDNLPW